MSDNGNGKNFEIFGWSFKRPKEQEIAAPYVKPENDDAAHVIGANYYGQQSYNLTIDNNFANEADQIIRYRETSLYSEVDMAVSDIVNEAISGDDESSPVKIVTDDLTEYSKSIKDMIHTEFETILEKLDFNENSYETFRKYYVDGRIYYFKIIDPKNPRAGIQELRHIPATHIKKVREENLDKTKSGITIVKSYNEYYMYSPTIFTNKDQSTAIKLAADSIAYANSGLVDEQNGIVLSYIHKAIKPANQLRILEDAVLVYTLARAPQRRIFYVDTGNLPRAKAEEYLKSVMNKFRNKMVYDATTGEIKDATKTLSMLEDIWLPRREGGKATEIDTLEGATMGGQIDVLDYFRKKLYMSLNVPISRITWEPNQGFSSGRPSEITREEIKFSKFISRLRKKFNGLFLDLLKTQLLLKQIITENDWEKIKEKITFDYISDSHFKELKEADILRERLALVEQMEPFVGLYFSHEYVRKKILMQNDEDIKIIDEQITKEAALQEKIDAQNNEDNNDNDIDPEGDDDDAWDEDRDELKDPDAEKNK